MSASYKGVSAAAVGGVNSTRVPFGNSAGTGLTSSADFTYNDTTKLLTVTGGANGGIKTGSVAFDTNYGLDVVDATKGNIKWGNSTLQGYLSKAGGTRIELGALSNHPLALAVNAAEVIRWGTDSLTQFAAASTIANGTGTVTVGNLAPGTTNVTIQEWLTIKNSAGTSRRIPLFNV